MCFFPLSSYIPTILNDQDSKLSKYVEIIKFSAARSVFSNWKLKSAHCKNCNEVTVHVHPVSIAMGTVINATAYLISGK